MLVLTDDLEGMWRDEVLQHYVVVRNNYCGIYKEKKKTVLRNVIPAKTTDNVMNFTEFTNSIHN